MKTCAGSITFTLMACRQENLNCTKGGQKHDTLAEHKSYNALLNAELLLFWRTLLADEKGTRAISIPLQLAASIFLIPRANLFLFDSISHSPGPPCLLVMWLCIWPILFLFFPLETQWPPSIIGRTSVWVSDCINSRGIYSPVMSHRPNQLWSCSFVSFHWWHRSVQVSNKWLIIAIHLDLLSAKQQKRFKIKYLVKEYDLINK